MENKDLYGNQRMIGLCIQQGYVPPYCMLNGYIVSELIKKGKNPCIGCNLDCCNAKKEYLPHEIKELKKDYIFKDEEIKRENRISKRKSEKYNFYEGYMFIDIVDSYKKDFKIIVVVMKPLEEKMYSKTFHDIDTAVHFIPYICKIYKVSQIYIDKNGFGIKISDALLKMDLEKVGLDVIPMVSLPMYLLM